MITLSNRLQIIADKIVEGSKIADIGSDHALLPSYLVEKGFVSFAVAGEINDGPLEAAKKQVTQKHLQHKIDVRKGNGLSVLNPNEVDTIIIAGMGGSLITQILSQGSTALIGVRQLILQPNVGEEIVRRWLFEHDWYLLEENIVFEDGKVYEILHAKKEKKAVELNQSLYSLDSLACKPFLSVDLLFRMGPHLTRNPSAPFYLKWKREMEKWRKICMRLSHSTLETSKQKLTAFQQDIDEMRRVLDCLQKVKP